MAFNADEFCKHLLGLRHQFAQAEALEGFVIDLDNRIDGDRFFHHLSESHNFIQRATQPYRKPMLISGRAKWEVCVMGFKIRWPRDVI